MSNSDGSVQHNHRRVKFNAEERKAKVARLYLGRNTIASMARMLEVTTQTIQRDLKDCREQWQGDQLENTAEQITRELEELQKMESDCDAQFLATKDPVWIEKRMRIKERRAKLMGLDKPSQIQQVGEVNLNIIMPPEDPLV